MSTLAQIRSDVRDLIGDPEAQSNTWTQDQVDSAINAAILNYCEKTGVSYKEMILVADASGIIPLPASTLKVERVFLS